MDKYSNVTEKKKRITILTRVSFLFLVAILVSGGISAFVCYRTLIIDSAEDGMIIAKGAGISVMTAIGSEEQFYRLYDDEEFREKTRTTFHFICEEMQLQRLYLYTLDDTGYRHFIISAAKENEDDEYVRTEFGFGAVQASNAYDAEKNVMEGVWDEDYEILNDKSDRACVYVFPIMNGEKHVLALLGAEYTTDQLIHDGMNDLRYFFLLELLFLIIFFMIDLYLIRREVIKPIVALSESMRAFARDRDIAARPEKRQTRFEDEITDIERSFNEMATDIYRYVNHIEVLTSEKVQTQTQLDIAKKIQNGMVPAETALSESGYEAFGCERPAKEVGGDFYDIIKTDDNKICVVVGDISGKGVFAALFMVMVKTYIRGMIKDGHSLADTLNHVNVEICRSNPENMFATIFALEIDIDSGRITYANAGHDAPLLLKGEPSFLEVDSGTALGIFEDAEIIEEELQLKDGEGILIYTDGVLESINKDKEQYGGQRLLDTVRKVYADSGDSYDPQKVVREVVTSVRLYEGELDQFDDITCVALVCGGKQ